MYSRRAIRRITSTMTQSTLSGFNYHLELCSRAFCFHRCLIKAIQYFPDHAHNRSHSKNNDPADIQTQIWEVSALELILSNTNYRPLWQVVFEPDPKDNNKTTSHVATCGGNSICIIDVNSGTVLMKYKHKDIKENFYTLAWTTLTLDDEKTNILASGGIRGEIRMFHPQNKVGSSQRFV